MAAPISTAPLAAAPVRLKTVALAPVAPAVRETHQVFEETTDSGSLETSDATEDEPRRFRVPWKVVAAAAAVIAAVIAFPWVFSGTGSSALAKPTAVLNVHPKPAPPPVPGGTLAITTEPDGLRVLLDGKTAGVSPLNLSGVAVGRHTITVVGESGTVKRAIRVEDGKTISLDLPVYSGFAQISAPIVLEISENGNVLGTTDEQLMLGPGHHSLTLTNVDLAYTGTQSIEVQPGAVTRLSVHPTGKANINAQPWAEVWVDGAKIGETPMANVDLPLGSRDIVFKNPQFGERKITVTITAKMPAVVTVDLTKQ
jgi:hypothetical protein